MSSTGRCTWRDNWWLRRCWSGVGDTCLEGLAMTAWRCLRRKAASKLKVRFERARLSASRPSGDMATLDSIAEGQVPSDAEAAKRFMSKLMNTSVRAHIDDGRIISGQLWCFDQLKNLILLSGYETRDGEGQSEHRALGPLILVPGKYIRKLEATKTSTEAAIAAANESEFA
eukprot:s30_g9.t1